MMKRALVSVSDKTNLVPFVSSLVELGYEIISTGGTKKALEAAGIKTIGISEVTDFPEIMDGRVKTLHPKVHGALLCVRDNPDHVRQIEELGIQYIDLVCVNLYPFKETVQKPGVSHEEIIENIDIGGPSMLRSASKNYKFIPVLCDPSDYDAVVKELRENGETSLTTREYLAAKVFRHTASYDTMIASYLTERTGEKYPEKFTITFDKVQELRYGENPHQSAAFYKGMDPQYSLANAKQLHGKELSYNNIQDGNAAIEILKDFEGQPAVVGLKHMNPCGVGIGKTIEEAWDKAYEADPVSIFGGIVAFNEPIHASVAEKLSKIFLEIIIAPAFDEDAFEILSKKKNIRLMQLDTSLEVNARYKVTNVNDGLLVQDIDDHKITAEDLRCVTNRKPTEEELEQLLFAWKVVKHVKSNAIVLVKDNMTIGVGAGQMNRVGAAKIAIEQAGEKAKGSIMSSDAFFPMPDTVEEAVKAGVTAIIQPGGSIKDQLSIDVCNEHGIAMVYTGVRHFKH
ncbi:bifunctional phosphoribosylaminoimidazolecarboxamide formyltransferase/IMP cyclohydrolase [[Clostridium] innocuum]|uniref:bifunctional phosphoribosylaminoimidazolecarboxamide formyltransferase/IMP cyclohydrolase n=2 Tax=Clostridium innocuum TaxID=1522 RepID=UPI003B01B3CA